jgi:hypothetical protein
MNVGWSGAFAGKPAPTGIAVSWRSLLAPSFRGFFVLGSEDVLGDQF